MATNTQTPPYHIARFVQSSFSSPQLMSPPEDMEEEDLKLFLESLNAHDDASAIRAARLWEDTLFVKYPHPFFVVRVADVRASLLSPATALELYDVAASLISREEDPEFHDFVDDFGEKCETLKEALYSSWVGGDIDELWCSTAKRPFPTHLLLPPPETESLRNRWQTVKQSRSGDELFYRHFCIETNHLERSFLLTPESSIQLILSDFNEGDIEILPDSNLQDESLIVSVLKDTYNALERILDISQDPKDVRLTMELILEIHTDCMKTSRILPSLHGGVPQIRYMNIGETRQVTCKNVMIQGPPRVQFCPFQDVEKELATIARLGQRQIAFMGANPFAVAAWLHLIFVSCHPFEDGNGRMSRLLASIPLLRAGLPPLSVPVSLRETYFIALSQARSSNDYEPLIRCFVQSLSDAVAKIETLPR